MVVVVDRKLREVEERRLAEEEMLRREEEKRIAKDIARRQRVLEGKNKARVFMNREHGMNVQLLDRWDH
jgi:hypothetical protein